MGRGTEVPPLVIGIVIVVVLAIIGGIYWRTMHKGTVNLNNNEQMRQAVERAMGPQGRSGH